MGWLRRSVVALAIAAVWGVVVWVVLRWVFDVDDSVGMSITASGVLLGTLVGDRLREKWKRRRR
ncbi:hypothetical protein G3I40_05465 [Streptomyces sp. SID14478]|uniref:hypothetical protein n=1 Tax=Streptomyces sp. SID14478 TaxID=2706073 RepID=UPI0013DB3410|nr:hypothetical protein [Streptomyces sp. SID14478]NEB74681.1 hypothetical protein [Streptomyces sp. SID14478]